MQTAPDVVDTNLDLAFTRVLSMTIQSVIMAALAHVLTCAVIAAGTVVQARCPGTELSRLPYRSAPLCRYLQLSADEFRW
jgi:hypothetical protein